MGKLTLEGPVPEDDPMFSGKVEFFTRAGCQSEATPKSSAQDGLGQEPVPAGVVRITADWGGDLYTLDLELQTWLEITAGRARVIEIDEYLEGLDLRWLFNSEPGYSLVIDYGDPNHFRFFSQLDALTVTFGPK